MRLFFFIELLNVIQNLRISYSQNHCVTDLLNVLQWTIYVPWLNTFVLEISLTEPQNFCQWNFFSFLSIFHRIPGLFYHRLSDYYLHPWSLISQTLWGLSTSLVSSITDFLIIIYIPGLFYHRPSEDYLHPWSLLSQTLWLLSTSLVSSITDSLSIIYILGLFYHRLFEYYLHHTQSSNEFPDKSPQC